ncbi:AAA family ATPase [Candidatus Woesearchaeota archaeon]|nr:AAA family ATPase [Candidatus Woesearchaeota archaeon]
MKKLIVITGTPGVGKSTLAKKLARRLKLKRIDLHNYYSEISLGYDRKNKCHDIDFKKFIALMTRLKEEHGFKKKGEVGIILDSHIAHLLPKRLIDFCIILTCSDLKVLERRLKKRKYSLQKIRDNLEAEIMQVCLLEAKEKGYKVIVIDSCRKIDVKEIARVLSA